MHVHGNNLDVEFPRRVQSVWKTAAFTRITGKPYTSNWVHFTIPTPVSDDQRDLAILGSVVVRFRTFSRRVYLHSLRIYDGERQLAAYDRYWFSPNDWYELQFRLPGQPRI